MSWLLVIGALVLAGSWELGEQHTDAQPGNAVQTCELLHASCMSVNEIASERGLATPSAFARYVCDTIINMSTQLEFQRLEFHGIGRGSIEQYQCYF
jgi:hypothetical protein